MRWALLKISLIALALMSWVFVGFLFDSRPDSEVAAEMADDPLVSLVRLPASLQSGQLPKVFHESRAFEPIRMEVIKLGCWDIRDQVGPMTSARWVRLTGRPCQSDPGVDAIRVTNITNGYRGTVFLSESQNLTTDFIPLSEGENELLLELGWGQGPVWENRIVLLKKDESLN